MMYLPIKILILSIVISQICCLKKLEIKNLNEDLILIIKTNNCKIQTGSIKLIHPINLTNLETTVVEINKFSFSKANDNLDLDKIIKQKCKRLHENLQQIKPKRSNRQKRWDALGTGWKWLAGSPDALDLRIINSTMNELIQENNQQFQINKQINERIRLITDTVSRAVTTSATVNEIILTEIEMLATIISIDMVSTILEDIREAIVRTKVQLPYNKILSLKEITLVKDLLTNQGLNITLPDEAMQYVTPKIVVNEETLLYILEVPKLQDGNSAALLITPLTINGTIIKDYPRHLIRSNQQLFQTSNHRNFVQRHSDTKEFEDDCIKPLILGTRSHCNVSEKTGMTVQLIAEDKLLIDNAIKEKLSSDCGPNNRTVTGNFLLTFWNCTIEINNRRFQSYEITSEAQEIQGALYNLNATRQLIKDVDTKLLYHQNIQNRKKISHVYLKQSEHRFWIWTLSGGVSLSTIAIIVLFVYIGVNANIIKRKTEHEIIQCSTILANLEIKPKDEDALSLPRGGVMLQ